MGTVHGVYLKYVGLSALSYAGYSYFARDGAGRWADFTEVIVHSLRTPSNSSGHIPISNAMPALVFGYSTVVNGVIAVLFKIERFMAIIGKNRKTGQMPLWSYIVYFPFHLPTRLYTYIHTRMPTYTASNGSKKREIVPVASECEQGWWVGGCYSHELNKEWAVVIDLTVEFPESCINRTSSYLSIPSWDGVPATPAQLEEAAHFAISEKAAHGNSDVLVHCAHGRGRSTTVMCACLVKAGLYSNWEEAFNLGIRPHRPVCKLNRRMRQNLTEWQRIYVDSKKGL
jgi:protein-tyrosine phosphatase